MPIFIQRAQHQHIHTLGMDSLYVSVYLPPFGVAAIGCHYGAGRTVFLIERRCVRVTEKQKIFADEYLIYLNATRDYKVAYPAVKRD